MKYKEMLFHFKTSGSALIMDLLNPIIAYSSTHTFPSRLDFRHASTNLMPSAPSCTVGKSIMPGSKVPSFFALMHSMKLRYRFCHGLQPSFGVSEGSLPYGRLPIVLSTMQPSNSAIAGNHNNLFGILLRPRMDPFSRDAHLQAVVMPDCILGVSTCRSRLPRTPPERSRVVRTRPGTTTYLGQYAFYFESVMVATAFQHAFPSRQAVYRAGTRGRSATRLACRPFSSCQPSCGYSATTLRISQLAGSYYLLACCVTCPMWRM